MMVQRRNPRSGPQQPRKSLSGPSVGGLTALPEWGAATALTRIPGIGGPGSEYGALNRPKSKKRQVYRRKT